MPEETTNAPAAPHIKFVQDTETEARKLPVWVGVLVILAIFAVSLWLALNPEWVMRLGRWGYIGAFLISAVASATIILPAPGIAVVIAMAEALDPVLLGIIAGVGSAIGELTGYVAGASGRAFVPEKQRLQFERLQNLTNRYGALLLFFLAAIPFPLFDFAGIIAGMMRMNALLFVVTVALGKSIKYVIMILVGAGFLQVLQQLILWITSG
jgi:membrane protein YqaA with SNARE-associated domain